MLADVLPGSASTTCRLFIRYWKILQVAQPAFFKGGSDSLCETVANWDEVCSAFLGYHEWRGMMEDGRNGGSCAEMNPARREERHRFCFKGGEEQERHSSSNMRLFTKHLAKFAPPAKTFWTQMAEQTSEKV